MNKLELKQLIKEELRKALNEKIEDRYSFPYYELRVEDYSFGSLVSSIYDQMVDYGSFKDISDKSDSGGIYLFQSEDDFNNFYENLESNQIPEKAIVGIENN